MRKVDNGGKKKLRLKLYQAQAHIKVPFTFLSFSAQKSSIYIRSILYWVEIGYTSSWDRIQIKFIFCTVYFCQMFTQSISLSYHVLCQIHFIIYTVYLYQMFTQSIPISYHVLCSVNCALRTVNSSYMKSIFCSAVACSQTNIWSLYHQYIAKLISS